MAPADAYKGDMGDLSHLSEREIDRLLAGNPAVDGPEGDLAGIVRDLRGAYLAPPAEATQARHLAAMAEEARVAESEDSPVRPRSEKAHRRPRARVLKEATVTRIRTTTLAAKLAAATLVAVLATGGLAAAGFISLPDSSSPDDDASQTAKDVHDAIINGGNPAEKRCGFGLSVAEAASGGEGDRPDAEVVCNVDARVESGKSNAARGEGNGKGNSARGGGDVGTQEHGGPHPDGQDFGDAVSESATTGGGKYGDPRDNGQAFGDAVSEDAQKLGPRPEPSQGGRGETGEGFSQQGQNGGNASNGLETAGDASGGRAP